METLKTELFPIDGRKSFYEKAYYQPDDAGQIVLYSYLRAVAHCEPRAQRIYVEPGISQTTDRHIRAFISVMTAEYGPLEVIIQNK